MNKLLQAHYERLWDAQNGHCCYCDCQMVSRLDLPNEQVHFPATLATLEHIVPKSLGGGTTQNNLALACRQCNQTKGDTPPPGYVPPYEKIGRVDSAGFMQTAQGKVWVGDSHTLEAALRRRNSE